MQKSCIFHRETPFELYPDYLVACQQNQPQAAVCWALECATNARLQALEEKGETSSSESLWLDLTLGTFAEAILHAWGRSAIQEALGALEARGFVSSRYIKRTEGRQVGIYTSYREARRDTALRGMIVKQYYYHCDRVQGAIAGQDRANQGVNSEATPSAPTGAQPRGKLRRTLPRVQHTSSTPQNQQGGC